MKISTSFDFGDSGLKCADDIKISVHADLLLGDIWQLPDMRAVIADSIKPVLKHLGMSERVIDDHQEMIRYSGRLADEVTYPYVYSVEDNIIRDTRDGTRYPVSDWLEGKLPD